MSDDDRHDSLFGEGSRCHGTSVSAPEGIEPVETAAAEGQGESVERPEPADIDELGEAVGAAEPEEVREVEATVEPADAEEATDHFDNFSTAPSDDWNHHIEVDENASIDDEAYAESSAASQLVSITSEIRRGIEVYGRRYAAYGQNEYGVPIDDRELDRQELQHYSYTLLQGDKLYLAPLKDDIQKILDIGTGKGVWCIDMADHFPSAEVLGIDLAPVQPDFVPPNCEFMVDDCEEDWAFRAGEFDYVHSRDLFLSVRDWPRLVRQAYTHLKPGGWIELAGIVPRPQTDEDGGVLPTDAAYVELCATLRQIGRAFGAPLDDPLLYADHLRAAGFRNVAERRFKVPISDWPKDPKLKQIGVLERENVIEGAEGFMLRGFTEKLGKQRVEMELLLMRLRKELFANTLHAYVPFVAAYGQKPGAD